MPWSGKDNQGINPYLPVLIDHTSDLQFRQMKLEDVPRVHDIDTQSFTLPWPEKSYVFELTKNPSSVAIVAEISTTDSYQLVIGMAVVWVVVDEAHIATIAIHPDYRGHGYGKKLLAEVMRQVIRKGVSLATLEVREHNLLAQQLYYKFGFRIVGRRAHYYKDNNEDAVLMTVDKLGLKYLDRLSNLGA